MSNKRLNKILNKIIVILIVFIIGALTKEKITDNNSEKENTVINSILEIYYFDVGQADSILIKEDNYKVLIDGGNKEDGEYLVKYLKEELNINDLNIVVGTHPHEDHIGGLSDIINELNIDKIYLPNVTTTSKIFETLLDSIEDNDYKITVPKINEEIKLKNMNFKVLYTGTDESDLNNSSIVLKLNYGKTSYLFMGDAEVEVEEKILNKDISSDFLKLGHHGSSYSTSESFLKKVNPKYAIISVGKDNVYNHPTELTLDKLNNKNIKIYRTDECGTIKVTSDGKNINIKTIKTNING